MRISFGPWTLDVDVEATASAYAAMAQGSAADCGCTDCRNWIEQRTVALPTALITQLEAMGIDPTKETEISEYEGGQMHADQNLYWGEYLFIGSVVSGPECYLEQPDGKGCTIKLEQLFPGTLIGASSNTLWANVVPPFNKESCSALAFQVHCPRGNVYA